MAPKQQGRKRRPASHSFSECAGWSAWLPGQWSNCYRPLVPRGRTCRGDRVVLAGTPSESRADDNVEPVDISSRFARLSPR